jgi:hypothetical protein
MADVWRWLSETVDDLTVAMAKVFAPPAFRASVAGGPPPLEDLVAEQRARPPRLHLPARLERRVGRLRLSLPAVGAEAFCDFHPAARPDADTLVVYHHGLREFPHDGSAARVLTRGRLRERADWIVIRGPHHEDARAVDERLLASQEMFSRCLVASVFAAREIAARLRDRYRHVVLGGMSMGGVIALIEAAVGSAFDLHVPIVAGPDLGDVLMRSSFSRVVACRYRKRCVERGIVDRLDLARYLGRADGPPIRAILASYDRLFLLDAQRRAYARVPRARVEDVSGGHLTVAMRFSTVARIIRDALERELWSKSAPPLPVPAAATQLAGCAAA